MTDITDEEFIENIRSTSWTNENLLRAIRLKEEGLLIYEWVPGQYGRYIPAEAES